MNISLPLPKLFTAIIVLALSVFLCAGCGEKAEENNNAGDEVLEVSDVSAAIEPQVKDAPDGEKTTDDQATTTNRTLPDIKITEDYRAQFDHGEKGAAYQKYIVLHDTEGGGTPGSVVDYWAGNGNLVAAHFVIGKDGSIVQCVPMDKIAHHAGFGNTGHNEEFGVADDGRDDKKGTKSIGSWASDYGMNAWSVGIELVHSGSSGEAYPEAQLLALDALIAYIDAYYGFESKIIDHKMWREGNSDTSKEFAKYFANYKDHRTHN